MKKAIAVAVAMAAASGANAAWVSGTSSNPAGELILTVWDATQEKAFSQDLGILTRDAMAGNITDGYTVTLDAGGLAHLGAGASIQWNIAGADQTYANYDATTDRLNGGIYLTNSGAAPSVVLDPLSTTAANIDFYFATYDNQIMAGAAGADPVVLSSGNGAHAGEGNIWGSSMGGFISNVGMTSTSGIDQQTLEAWMFNGLFSDFSGVVEKSGKWTLDFSKGELVYSAVPVPAAAWLFGSALIGLAAVGRRRNVLSA